MVKKKRPILIATVVVFAAMSTAVMVVPPWRETVALVAAISYSDITKPNDPVTHALREHPVHAWGERVNLIPAPLSEGATRMEVESQLTKAGYHVDPDRKLSFRHSYDLPPEAKVYEMTASEGGCRMRYGVAVQFDSSDRLIEASGARDEAGCL